QMRASRGSRGATRALAPIGLQIALGWLSACSPTPVPADYSRSDASTARADGAAASAASPIAAATPAARESVRLAYTSIVGVAGGAAAVAKTRRTPSDGGPASGERNDKSCDPERPLACAARRVPPRRRHRAAGAGSGFPGRGRLFRVGERPRAAVDDRDPTAR